MKIKLLLAVLLFNHSIQAQYNDEGEEQVRNNKPEIFNKGSMDVSVNGQLNANARLIKINIGEYNKFYVPASLFLGVTTKVLGTYTPNDELLLNFVNPYSGLISLCIDDQKRFRKKPKNVTGFSVIYQLGTKILNGYDTTTKKVGLFNSSFLNSGVGFITQAWENSNENTTKGFFWIQCKVHYTKIPQMQVHKITQVQYNDKVLAYSILTGIDIAKSISCKFSFYKYIQNPLSQQQQPMIQGTVNYYLK